MQEHRKIEQLGRIPTGTDAGMQIGDQSRERGANLMFLIAADVSGHHRHHPRPQRVDRHDLATGSAVANLPLRAPHRLDRRVGVPVGRCGDRQLDQFRRGDLKRVSQSRDLREV